MKKKSLIMVGLVMISLGAMAQQVNTDSLSIISRISDYQLKRAKLQNTIKQTTWDKQDAASKAQTSAEKNVQGANRLNSDPQNRQLAKEADNSASDSKRDSRNARNANRKLVSLNKQISDLDGKIFEQQQKLSAYTNEPRMMMTIPSTVTDTTHPS